MKGQFELTQFKKNIQALNLNLLNDSTQKKVLRLLNADNKNINAQLQTKIDQLCLYLSPQSTFVLIWHLLFIILFYWIELQISVSLAFGVTFFQELVSPMFLYYPFYLFNLAFLVADILLSFFKGYYVFGRSQIINNPKKIIIHYLKYQFYYDIIIIIIYIIPLFYQTFQINFLQLIPIVLLWIKKQKYSQDVEIFLEYQPGIRAIFLFTSLVSNSLMMANYAACLFLGMDLYLYNQSYYGQGVNSPYYWLSDNVDYALSLMAGPWTLDGPWLDAYIYAQSFAGGTLSTLAPGPFPRNPWQAVYVIIVMILFVILASYIGDVAIQISYTYFERRWRFQQHIVYFDNFMQLKQVQKGVRMRVNNYFELVWQVQMKIQSNQQDYMIDKLPTYLKEQLLLEIGFTKYIYFLHQLPKEKQIKKNISLKIQRKTIDSGTTLFQSHTPLTETERNIMYIKQGMAKFYFSKDCQHHQTYNKNYNKCLVKNQTDKIINLSNVEKVLGVYQFITGQNYTFCCKSIDLCLVQNLSWTNFWQIVKQLKIQEQFHELKHRVLLENDMSLINKVCVICLSNHLQSQCPGIMPRIKLQSYQNIENKFNSNKQNIRKKINRKRLKSKKRTVIGQNYSFKQVLNMLSNVNFGRLLLQITILQGGVGTDVEKIAIYQNYFGKYNIINE